MLLSTQIIWVAICWLVSAIDGLPVTSGPANTAPKDDVWSREAVLTLIGVLVAIVLFIVGLVFKNIRNRAINIFACQCYRASF